MRQLTSIHVVSSKNINYMNAFLVVKVKNVLVKPELSMNVDSYYGSLSMNVEAVW